VTDEFKIPAPLAQEMIDHSLAGRPNEACGVLGSREGELVKVFRMTNASASPVRYSLEPQEQFAVYKTLDDEGWDLAGVFHSHTRTEAYPSPTDVRLASEDVPYLIVSLASEPPVIRAFRIIKDSWTDNEGLVKEVPVVIER
jgi:proteasome lid subunit RPN8/RPN11